MRRLAVLGVLVVVLTASGAGLNMTFDGANQTLTPDDITTVGQLHVSDLGNTSYTIAPANASGVSVLLNASPTQTVSGPTTFRVDVRPDPDFDAGLRQITINAYDQGQAIATTQFLTEMPETYRYTVRPSNLTTSLAAGSRVTLPLVVETLGNTQTTPSFTIGGNISTITAVAFNATSGDSQQYGVELAPDSGAIGWYNGTINVTTVNTTHHVPITATVGDDTPPSIESTKVYRPVAGVQSTLFATVTDNAGTERVMATVTRSGNRTVTGDTAADARDAVPDNATLYEVNKIDNATYEALYAGNVTVTTAELLPDSGKHSADTRFNETGDYTATITAYDGANNTDTEPVPFTIGQLNAIELGDVYNRTVSTDTTTTFEFLSMDESVPVTVELTDFTINGRVPGQNGSISGAELYIEGPDDQYRFADLGTSHTIEATGAYTLSVTGYDTGDYTAEFSLTVPDYHEPVQSPLVFRPEFRDITYESSIEYDVAGTPYLAKSCELNASTTLDDRTYNCRSTVPANVLADATGQIEYIIVPTAVFNQMKSNAASRVEQARDQMWSAIIVAIVTVFILICVIGYVLWKHRIKERLLYI